MAGVSRGGEWWEDLVVQSSSGPGEEGDVAKGGRFNHRCVGDPDLTPPKPSLVAALLYIFQPSHLRSILK